MTRLLAGTSFLAAALSVTPASAQTDIPADQVRVHASQGCLAAAIYHEARSEPEAGQRAVAQVIMNRLRHPNYPKTVCDVVLQGATRVTGCQFTFTCDGSLARLPEPRAWSKAMAIAADALEGRNFSVVGDATHYHAKAVRPYWAPTLTPVATLGSHIFYASGRLGRNQARNASGRTIAPADASRGEAKISVIYAESDSGGNVPVKVHRGGIPPVTD